MTEPQMIRSCQDTTAGMLPFDQHPFLASTIALLAISFVALGSLPVMLALNGRAMIRALSKQRDEAQP